MITFRFVTVGKIKKSARYLEEGINLYEKRLRHYVDLEWVEIQEESPSATRTVNQILDKEAQSILNKCERKDTVVVLNEKGALFDSKEFSQWLVDGLVNHLSGGRDQSGSGRIIIIIGGAYGTSQRLVSEADKVISLSKLTFPHQMVRLILLEQLYRAFTISNGEPYHK